MNDNSSPEKESASRSSGFQMPKINNGVRRLTTKLESLMINQPKSIIEHSDDPLDYGMIRYSDLEIADHSIMIEGLPKSIPRLILE